MFVRADRAFWAAIFGLYLMGVVFTAIVVFYVLGNRGVQYDTLSRIHSIDCVLSVPATERTIEHIRYCRSKYGVPEEATPIQR